ncbi:hypothetical protein BDW68DRAFT_170244 [Aspergillus falconensis]
MHRIWPCATVIHDFSIWSRWRAAEWSGQSLLLQDYFAPNVSTLDERTFVVYLLHVGVLCDLSCLALQPLSDLQFDPPFDVSKLGDR